MENIKVKRVINVTGADASVLKPLGANVLLEYQYPEDKRGTILLVQTEENNAIPVGKVVAVSEEIKNNCKEGEYPKVGEKVYFQRGMQSDLFLGEFHDRPSHCMIAWYDLLAVVEE